MNSARPAAQGHPSSGVLLGHVAVMALEAVDRILVGVAVGRQAILDLDVATKRLAPRVAVDCGFIPRVPPAEPFALISIASPRMATILSERGRPMSTTAHFSPTPSSFQRMAVPPDPPETSTRSPALMSANACSSSSTYRRTGVTPWMTQAGPSRRRRSARGPPRIAPAASPRLARSPSGPCGSGRSSPVPHPRVGKRGPSMAMT